MEAGRCKKRKGITFRHRKREETAIKLNDMGASIYMAPYRRNSCIFEPGTKFRTIRFRIETRIVTASASVASAMKKTYAMATGDSRSLLIGSDAMNNGTVIVRISAAISPMLLFTAWTSFARS